MHHEGDLVWAHGFHLLVVPKLLSKAHAAAKIGVFLHTPFPSLDIFLHTPFPSSEIFRTLERREEMLSADQVAQARPGSGWGASPAKVDGPRAPQGQGGGLARPRSMSQGQGGGLARPRSMGHARPRGRLCARRLTRARSAVRCAE